MKKKIRKGVALIWAVVLATILLIVSTTMATYIIKESRFSMKITDSTQAYANARSGIEWANYCVENSIDPDVECVASFDLDTGDNRVNVDVSAGDCRHHNADEADYCIESIGSYKDNIFRKLEYEVKKPNYSLIEITDPISNINLPDNKESFVLQFDFWTDLPEGGISWSNSIGLGELERRIYFFLGYSTNPDKKYHPQVGTRLDGDYHNGDNDGLESYVNYSILEDGYRNVPYRYRAEIRYIKDTAASLKVYRKILPSELGYNPDRVSYKCVGYADKSQIGLDLGNLNSFFTTGGFSAEDNPYNPSKKYLVNTTNGIHFYYDNFVLYQ